ncbi:MAG: UDP-2,3-diacylglucosamine diphosphatase LpxI [Myxococcaceae bacterium]|nr:UDP-2,3-diacylglucosamine diphosphatase LpxI [Myxococcaceae bacterium]
MQTIGLIAGNGLLPHLFADAAKSRGMRVVAVAHRGETDARLAGKVDALEWVRVGQLGRIARILRGFGARQAVLAGGIGRVRAFTEFRPDLGAVKVVARLRSFGDDALLRAIAGYLEDEGVRIVAPTDFLPEVLAPEGLIAGSPPDAAQRRDIALGLRTAALLGRADVGQTVVVKNGHVLALEAVEGTDEAIRRGGRYGGAGACIVKLSKPGQDARFDLPAVGPGTIHVMSEVGATLLAVEAGRTVLLDAAGLVAAAQEGGVTVVGVDRVVDEPSGR